MFLELLQFGNNGRQQKPEQLLESTGKSTRMDCANADNQQAFATLSIVDQER